MKIVLKDLSKTYEVEKNKVDALNGVNLTINQGDFIAVCGVSGSGKSTLLNLLGGMDKPTSGEILCDDLDITKQKDKELSEFRNKNIGFVFQDYALIPYRSVYENLEVPLMFSRIPRKEYKAIINKTIEQVGLADLLKRKVSTLSGGQKQRVAIARALVCDPMMILADEPTGALDSKSKQEVIDLLIKVNEMGKTIIVVTHDNDVAQSAKRIINIKDGKIHEVEDRNS